MEKQHKFRKAVRTQTAEFVGKQKFARKAYVVKKVTEAKNKAKEQSDARRVRISLFKECLERIKAECNYSIYTMPILAWWKLHESDDIAWMLKSKRKPTEQEKVCLNYLYKKLRAEFFKDIGFDDTMNEVNQLKLDIVTLTCNMWINDDISLLTDIEIKQQRLEALLKENEQDEPSTLLESVLSLKKICEAPDLTMNSSVAEFFAYKKMAKQHMQSWQETANQDL